MKTQKITPTILHCFNKQATKLSRKETIKILKNKNNIIVALIKTGKYRVIHADGTWSTLWTK